jgi:hypothetical protein
MKYIFAFACRFSAFWLLIGVMSAMRDDAAHITETGILAVAFAIGALWTMGNVAEHAK